MVTTWTNVLNGAATTVGATPGDAVPATLLADVLQISNSGSGLDTTLRDVGDGDGTTTPIKVSTQAVMLPNAAIWPYGDSTFFSSGQTGILIPYYIYPNNPYTDVTVTRLLGLIRQYRGKVPCIVVLNPGSGPGDVMDGNYAAFIKLIQAAGGKVAGYVSTAYGGTINPDRTEAAVKADVDTWLTLYASTPVDTIFFDEQTYDLGTNNEYVALYKRYTDYCHARNLAPVICNPGTNQREEYFAERTGDIIVTAETGTWPSESDMLGAYIGGHIDYKTSLRAALVYAQATLVPGRVKQLCRYVQWIYVTADTLSPNPWDSLSGHLEELFPLLAGRGALDAAEFGATGDGTTDDLTALQAAVNASAGKTLRVPAGTYMLSAKLSIPSNTHIVAEIGAVIKATAGNVSNPVLLEVSGKSDVLIEGLTIDGNLASIAGFNNVVTVFTCNRVVFERCKWQNTKGIAVIFSTSIVDSGVRNSFFNECGTYHKTSASSGDRKQGIAFSSGTRANNTGNFAIGNTFTEVGLDCISFSTQSNGLIQGNKIRVNYAGSIYVPSSINVKIIGNDVSNWVTGGSTNGNGIDVFNSDRITIVGNACYSCGAAGIMVADTDDFSIVGNICMNNWQSGTSVHRGGITLDTNGASVVTHGVIAGNRCGDDQGAKTQQYGYHIVASSNDSDIWVDPSNDFSGNAVSDFGGDAIGYSSVRGTYTASADAPVSGYISVYDQTGTLRKLAVIS